MNSCPSLIIDVISGNPGLLLTGGEGNRTLVELYSLQSRSSCRLVNLPGAGSVFHSQHQNILCGVGAGLSQCLSLKDGTWSSLHQLDGNRWLSSAWPVSDGLVVLGGCCNDDDTTVTTAVLATTDGEVRQLFTLQYKTQ